MKTKIGVIAGTRRQFDFWVMREVHHDDIELFTYVASINDVRGVKFSHVIRIGTWFENNQAQELYAIAKQRIE